MTKEEMHAELDSIVLSLHIHRAEVIAHLCGIGLGHREAKKTWLYAVLKELQYRAECWSIPLTPDSLSTTSILEEINQLDLFDA